MSIKCKKTLGGRGSLPDHSLQRSPNPVAGGRGQEPNPYSRPIRPRAVLGLSGLELRLRPLPNFQIPRRAKILATAVKYAIPAALCLFNYGYSQRSSERETETDRQTDRQRERRERKFTMFAGASFVASHTFTSERVLVKDLIAGGCVVTRLTVTLSHYHSTDHTTAQQIS